MSQSSDKHNQITGLFLAVCDLSQEDQTTSLQRLCRDDPALRAEVEILLNEDSQAEQFVQQRMISSSNQQSVRDLSKDVIRSSNQNEDLQHRRTGFPIIPSYEILDVLGHGGVGIVYRAKQMPLGREVALKVLPAMFTSADPTIVERFKREASAAAKLQHPNIVPVYDFGRNDECYYYAMELIRGAPLNAILSQLKKANGYSSDPQESEPKFEIPVSSALEKPISASLQYIEKPFTRDYFKRAAEWMYAVADGIHLAHEQGLVHRDLKPGNLIVSDENRIMIADFGLVMNDHEENITRTGAIMGTLRYMSPEQALGNRVPIDRRSDIYSLGATMYELLTLQYVFQDEKDHLLLAAIIGKDPTPPRKYVSDVPHDLEVICLKALEKLPQNRYATAKDMADDLLSYLEDRKITAQKPAITTTARRFIKRHRIAVISSTAILLLAITLGQIIGGYYYARTHEQVTEYLNQGLSQQKDHRWNTATQTYLSALELEPNNVRVLGNLAITLKEQYNEQSVGDPELLWQANDYLDQALTQTPKNAGLWNVKGVILKKLQIYPEAIISYQTAIEIEEASPIQRIAAVNNLAEVQWLAGDDISGETNLRLAAELADETNTPAWFAWQDLASFECMQGNADAIDHIKRGFDDKREPGWRLYLMRAKILLEIEDVYDLQAAIRDIYTALDQKVSDPRMERTAAIAMLRNREFDKAILHAENALTLNDAPSFAHFIIAIASAEIELWEDAGSHLQLANQLWPERIAEHGYTISTERGLLWFDTQQQLIILREEVDRLLR